MLMSNSNTINVTTLPGNSFYLLEGAQKALFLYLELKAAKAKGEKERIPLNISLVIDRSGSMAGAKLDYVKKAVAFVIDHLNQKDILSIVQYDNQVEVVSAAAPVTDKATLKRKVKAISSRGTTNLSGGMLEGYQQVAANRKEGYVNRVLLLSDGLANRGITEPAQLQAIAQKKFREERIGLSAFGVGADYNELLLTNLAEYGGANYYYIDSPEKIPEVFAEELEGLLTVVAQNTRLELEFPESQLEFKKLYGYPGQLTGTRISISLNDMFSGEEKAVLAEFTLKPDTGGPIQFELSGAYEDVGNTLDRIRFQEQIRIEPTSSTEEFGKGINLKTAENVALFLATDLYEAAFLASDRRDYAKARELTQKALHYLEAYFKLHGPAEQLNMLYEEIKKHFQQIDALKEMSARDYSRYAKMQRGSSYRFSKKRT